MIGASVIHGVLALAVQGGRGAGAGATRSPASACGNFLISLVVWLPLIGALVILALPNRGESDHGNIKNAALAFTAVPLLISLFAMWSRFTEMGIAFTVGYNYEEEYSCIAAFAAHDQVW